jgi:hypothetical protein
MWCDRAREKPIAARSGSVLTLRHPAGACVHLANSPISPHPQHIAHMIEQFARPRWLRKLLFLFRKAPILAGSGSPKCRLFFCICRRY